MEKTYNPASIEGKWYEHWMAGDWFKPSGGSATSNDPPYCIMLPPPNVTGSLHMGHAFQNTIMDTLIRWQRMRGTDTLWQPGTDHAGIATQMVVERQLQAEGKSRHDLGRKGFNDAVWAWKEQSGDTIIGQMKRLGASVDWSRHCFTMDEPLSKAVMTEFVQLYEEGLIYRGKRLVNWDPVLLTALSDLEVISEEENGHLWHIRYPRSDGRGHLVVATTRPETLLGDTAVAVHPGDERYIDLVGHELELPLTGRTIAVIADEYVDPEFGSGCVKITPAHDFNDYDIGKRHGLDVVNVLNPDGSLNDNAPEAYRGLDRFDARRAIVEDLQAAGLLERVDDHRLMIPRGDRSQAVVEPYLTDQWFVKIAPLAREAMTAVEDGRIRFVPESWNKTYFDWMHRIEDWCISRQLWWGHRIPAWYDPDGNIHVGIDEADARIRSKLADGIPLRQDEDVLDTWFSSGLWPFTTLGWPNDTPFLNRFYPSSVLVTGFDIIFFWVARMIMLGLKFMGDVPFRTVYIHGLIRDAQGQKMSKSKGNVLDPLDLIDGIDLESLVSKRTRSLMQPQMAPAIEQATRKEFPDGIAAFGTDALRFTFAALATHGRHIRFDLGRVEGYRNFCNKLWNAARFALMQTDGAAVTEAAETSVFDRWILSRLNFTVQEVDKHLREFRLDLAAQCLYEFIWNEYCDWYLEFSKPLLHSTDESIRSATQFTLLSVLESALRLLHPIMPFITEDIWQRVRSPLGIKAETIMTQAWPEAAEQRHDQAAEDDVLWIREVIQAVRRTRSDFNLPPRQVVDVFFLGGTATDRQREASAAVVLTQLGKIQDRVWLEDEADTSDYAVSLVGDLKVLVPLKGLIDVDAEIQRLNKLLSRESADLAKSEAKLSNSGFINKAPALVVKQEQERLASHNATVKNLSDQIRQLNSLRT